MVPALIIALMNNIGNDAATTHMFFGAIPSPFFAIDIIFMFLVVQQIEGNLITPALVGKSVGLHPMLVMIVLLIGGTLLGPLGMLFAVPATGVIKVILIEIAFLRKRSSTLIFSILYSLYSINVSDISSLFGVSCKSRVDFASDPLKMISLGSPIIFSTLM